MSNVTMAIERARPDDLPSFPRFEFERITREDVPASVRAPVEFQSACPASAVVMRRVGHPS